MKINNKYLEKEGISTKTTTVKNIYGDKIEITGIAICSKEDEKTKEIGHYIAELNLRKKLLQFKLKETKIKYKISKDFAQTIIQKKETTEETKKYINKMLNLFKQDILILSQELEKIPYEKEQYFKDLDKIKKKIEQRKKNPVKTNYKEIDKVYSVFTGIEEVNCDEDKSENDLSNNEN